MCTTAHYIDHGARPHTFETRTKIKEEKKKRFNQKYVKVVQPESDDDYTQSDGEMGKSAAFVFGFLLCRLLPGRYGIISSDP